MCIYVHSHALTHDVRPQIRHPFPNPADPSSPAAIVDPYCEPTPCRCEADRTTIAVWFRCEWHNCCRVVKRLVQCDQAIAATTATTTTTTTTTPPCENPVDYHRYEPQSLRGTNTTEPADEDEGWYPLPVVDSRIWYAEVVGMVETDDDDEVVIVERDPVRGAVRPAEEMARRALYVQLAAAAATSLKVLRCLADRVRDVDHRAEHAICSRVLNDGECRELRTYYRARAAFRSARDSILDFMCWAIEYDAQMPWAAAAAAAAASRNDGVEAKIAGCRRVVELDEWAAAAAADEHHQYGRASAGCFSEWLQRLQTIEP